MDYSGKTIIAIKSRLRRGSALDFFKWLRGRIKNERPAILSVVIVLYLVMIYQFYYTTIIAKLLRYFMLVLSGSITPNRISYIFMFLFAALFLLWSTIIVILSILELAGRFRERRITKRQ